MSKEHFIYSPGEMAGSVLPHIPEEEFPPEGSKLIPLTRGYYAIVDAEDYDFLMQWKWHVMSYNRPTHPYAGHSGLGMMHRFIMKAPKGKQVDHINRNSLDNRKANLRLCTQGQNNINAGLKKNNTSGFKGVSWSKRKFTWIARINVGRPMKYIGSFKNKEDAARAWDKEALKMHGEFALTNEMLGLYANNSIDSKGNEGDQNE